MGISVFKAILVGTAIFGTTSTLANAQGLAGPYLAASRAYDNGSFDAAAQYFVKAMAADSESVFLKRSALVSMVAAGDFRSAASVASVMASFNDLDVFVDLVMLVDSAQKGNFESALARLPVNSDQLSPMLWSLLKGWLEVGKGSTDVGLQTFDQMSDNETIALFGQYHKGLAHAYMGDLEAAAAIFDGDGNGPLHLNRDSIVTHAQILSELDRNKDALLVVGDAINRGFRDEQLLALRDEIAQGTTLQFTRADGPSYGMAEAFITMADAMSRGEPDRTALFYARLAQHLNPNSVDAALLVAEMLELEGQFEMAGEAYGAIPTDSPSFKDAEIGRAEVLREAGEVAVATEVLVNLAKRFPEDVFVLNALGDIYRGAENYKSAIKAYTRAIDNVETLGSQHWVLFYTRGIGHERLGDWPAAEADLRRALELSPNQPFALNYLGYSFIEMGIHLEEAQSMIETAVEGMPSNGYITDSLGWVLYRLGKFEEAVAPMERAVELLPVDPIVNDHLGDVLWMVGRKLEAKFQWRRAISFDPAVADLARIKRKLQVGLDVVLEEEASD